MTTIMAEPISGSPLIVFEGKRGSELWQKVCRHFGIDPKAAQHLLGEGTQAEVYEVEGGRVLKFTWDDLDARALALTAQHPDPHGNVVRVLRNHNAGVVEVRSSVGSIYVMEVERLTKLNQAEPFGFWIKAWHLYAVGAFPYKDVAPQNLDAFFDDMEKKYGNDREGWEEFKVWIEQLANYLVDSGIRYHDLWIENVMKRGSNYVVIDLGYSHSDRAGPISVISRYLDRLAGMLRRSV